MHPRASCDSEDSTRCYLQALVGPGATIWCGPSVQMRPAVLGQIRVVETLLVSANQVASIAFACIANASVPFRCIAYLALGQILSWPPF